MAAAPVLSNSGRRAAEAGRAQPRLEVDFAATWRAPARACLAALVRRAAAALCSNRDRRALRPSPAELFALAVLRVAARTGWPLILVAAERWTPVRRSASRS
jgi:hypothetical protein